MDLNLYPVKAVSKYNPMASNSFCKNSLYISGPTSSEEIFFYKKINTTDNIINKRIYFFCN